MSRIDGTGTGGEGREGGTLMESARGRRGASVTLRPVGGSGGDGGRAQSVGELMDPANRSLAEALKIAYRLLLLAIVVMIGLFAISGFQTIGASEVGVRVTLGKIESRDLQPGFHASWPQPIGDILRVDTKVQILDVRDAFFPKLTVEEEKTLISKGAQGLEAGARDYLDPDSDGMLLTADGYIVHMRWQVTYQRTGDSSSLETIATDDGPDQSAIEKQIVMAAIQRGVVHAAASLTIDEVLTNRADPGRKGVFRTVDELAKEETQKVLDGVFEHGGARGPAAGAGIQIGQFSVTEKMPPRNVLGAFNKVQSAQAQSASDRQKADEKARQELTSAAGEAAPFILAEIDRYDAELAAGKAREAEETLERIHGLMRQRPVTIDGKQVVASVSGDVSAKLSQAEQYRTSVVTRAQGEATVFDAKRESFRANPQVFLTGEWASAFGAFVGRDTVTMVVLPPGLERNVVQINKDPKVEEGIIAAIQLREAEAAQKKREQERKDQMFNRQYRNTGAE